MEEKDIDSIVEAVEDLIAEIEILMINDRINEAVAYWSEEAGKIKAKMEHLEWKMKGE